MLLNHYRYDWLTHDGSSYDCLDLAELAENLDFISHPACQAVIERKWKGGKSPEDKRIRVCLVSELIFLIKPVLTLPVTFARVN